MTYSMKIGEKSVAEYRHVAMCERIRARVCEFGWMTTQAQHALQMTTVQQQQSPTQIQPTHACATISCKQIHTLAHTQRTALVLFE